MNRNDYELGKMIFIIVAVCCILYLLAFIATSFIGAAAAGGTIYGGGTAIRNYGAAFKKNMIDSNRKTKE